MASIQGVIEQRIAIIIGGALQHGLTFGVENEEVNLLIRISAAQRRGMHKQLILVSTGVQTNIADTEKAVSNASLKLPVGFITAKYSPGSRSSLMFWIGR